MITRIHVNQHNIRDRVKGQDAGPVITVKDYRRNRKGDEAEVECPCCGATAATVTESIDSPLQCGARVWIETEGPVQIKK